MNLWAGGLMEALGQALAPWTEHRAPFCLPRALLSASLPSGSWFLSCVLCNHLSCSSEQFFRQSEGQVTAETGDPCLQQGRLVGLSLSTMGPALTPGRQCQDPALSRDTW